MVKYLPAMRETWVQSLDWEDPLEKEWQPIPVFLPGEFHGQRRLFGYSPWGCKESDITYTIYSQRSLKWRGQLQILYYYRKIVMKRFRKGFLRVSSHWSVASRKVIDKKEFVNGENRCFFFHFQVVVQKYASNFVARRKKWEELIRV